MKRPVRFRFSEFIFILLVLFSAVMLGFSSGGFVINFQKAGFTVLSSLQKGISAVTGYVTGTVTAVRDMANLQKEYKVLLEKLEDYEYLQRNNAEIRKENERLREQLDFATRSSYKNIAAQIIGRDPDNLYSGITIDKGARSGIKKGMPVVAIQNGNIGVVGKVVTVGVGTSLVMPVYDMHCNISARIQNTRDIGIVSGAGSVNTPLTLQYIRRRVVNEFQKGDVVVTSGENDNYARNIPIGRITSVRILDYDTSLVIDVEPIIDFARLETVMVLDQTLPNDRPPLEEKSE